MRDLEIARPHGHNFILIFKVYFTVRSSLLSFVVVLGSQEIPTFPPTPSPKQRGKDTIYQDIYNLDCCF